MVFLWRCCIELLLLNWCECARGGLVFEFEFGIGFDGCLILGTLFCVL